MKQDIDSFSITKTSSNVTHLPTFSKKVQLNAKTYQNAEQGNNWHEEIQYAFSSRCEKFIKI